MATPRRPTKRAKASSGGGGASDVTGQSSPILATAAAAASSPILATAVATVAVAATRATASSVDGKHVAAPLLLPSPPTPASTPPPPSPYLSRPPASAVTAAADHPWVALPSPDLLAKRRALDEWAAGAMAGGTIGLTPRDSGANTTPLAHAAAQTPPHRLVTDLSPADVRGISGGGGGGGGISWHKSPDPPSPWPGSGTRLGDTNSVVGGRDPRARYAAATTRPVTDLATAEDVRQELRFMQMEFNYEVMHEYVHERKEQRIQKAKTQIAQLEEQLKVPPQRANDLPKRQKISLAIAWLRQYVRFLESGEEQQLLLRRIKRMHASVERLPPEQKTKQTMVNQWILFMQHLDAEPSLDYKPVCPNPSCQKNPFIIRRKDSRMLCVKCGRFEHYLTIRSSVRLAPIKTPAPTSAPGYKEYVRFLNALQNYVYRPTAPEENPETQRFLRDAIHQSNLVRPRNQPVTAAELRKVAQERGFKMPAQLGTKLANAMNRIPSTPFLTLEEFYEISDRMKVFQTAYHRFCRFPDLVLPHPQVAYMHICILLRYSHLLRLFPLNMTPQQVATERMRIEQFLPLVRQIDPNRVWLIPVILASPNRAGVTPLSSSAASASSSSSISPPLSTTFPPGTSVSLARS